eukprot:2907291-Pyramimonas_sp.AAC.2
MEGPTGMDTWDPWKAKIRTFNCKTLQGEHPCNRIVHADMLLTGLSKHVQNVTNHMSRVSIHLACVNWTPKMIGIRTNVH